MKPKALHSILMKLISQTRRLPIHLRYCQFSSSSPAAITGIRSRNFISEDSESSSSPVYQHALKFQKPTTIKYTGQPINSASFIGTISSPLTKSNTTNGSLGIYTHLNVNSSPYTFHVSLKMWDEMAEMAMEHFKPNDFVYVWGQLRSFTKIYNQVKRIYYELIVKDINFVTPTDTVSKKLVVADEDWKDKYRMKLHLWQVFFSNPLEWRDLRKCKRNNMQPDFKHKDTGEALWLSCNDPPWIQRQLQLLDSRMGGLNFERRRNSSWSSDFGKYV